jgi:hypothetical protein
MSDVKVFNGGSIHQFMLITDAAHEWVEGHLSLESWQWSGTSAFVVDHRCAPDIIAGMIGDGLGVE